MNNIIKRICSICHQDFAPNKYTPTHQHVCIDCRPVFRKEYDKIRRRVYNQRPENQEKRRLNSYKPANYKRRVLYDKLRSPLILKKQRIKLTKQYQAMLRQRRNKRINRIKKHLMSCYSLYCRKKSLKKTAQFMNISYERVRQLLQYGNKYKLFIYKNRFDTLIDQLNNDIFEFEKDIVRYPMYIFRRKYHIGERFYKRLIEYFHLDPKMLKNQRKKDVILNQYNTLFRKYNCHPSTYKIQKHDKPLYNRIIRYYSSINNFRLQFDKNQENI